MIPHPRTVHGIQGKGRIQVDGVMSAASVGSGKGFSSLVVGLEPIAGMLSKRMVWLLDEVVSTETLPR